MVAATEQQQVSPGSASTEAEPSLRHLFDQLRARTYEFGAYARYLVSLQSDKYKLAAKRIAFYAALGVMGLAAGFGLLVFGMGLLLLGLSGLVGQLFGNFWLGATIMGVLVLIVPAVGAWIALKAWNRKAIAALRLKYVDIRQKQKRRFGRDIKEVAHAG